MNAPETLRKAEFERRMEEAIEAGDMNSFRWLEISFPVEAAAYYQTMIEFWSALLRDLRRRQQTPQFDTGE